MKKLTFCIIIVLTSYCFANSQTLDWVQYSDSKSSHLPRNMVIDNEDNIYLATSSRKLTNFLDESLNSDDDVVRIYKLNSEGQKIWRKDIVSTDYVGVGRMATDSNSNVYFIGAARGTISIDSLNYATNDSLIYRYICKLNKYGHVLFVKLVTGHRNSLSDIETNSFNEFFISGRFSKVINIEDTTLTTPFFGMDPDSTFYYDHFILKFSESGELLKVNVFKGGGNVVNYGEFSSLGHDQNGYIYCTGQFRDSIEINNNWLYAPDNSCLVIFKLNSETSEIEWVNTSQSIAGGGTSPYHIEVDQFGNAYVTGSYNGRTLFDTIMIDSIGEEYSEAFIVKYNFNGKAVWIKVLGGNYYISSGNSIGITNSNDIFWLGTYCNEARIEDTLLLVTPYPYSTRNVNSFLIKLSYFGSIMDILTLNSDYFMYSRDIAVSEDDKLFALCEFGTTVTYEGEDVTEMVLGNRSSDVFLAQFSNFPMGSNCLSEGVTFTSTADVQYFLQNYSHCTEINGDVTVRIKDISNLDFLNAVESIKGDLRIIDCNNLSNLTGLESLTSIEGSLIIVSDSTGTNENLENFLGMDNLQTIGGDFSVAGNQSLKNFVGLENLNSVGGDFIIVRNPTLENFTGLENLETIGGDLTIESASKSRNSSLMSLDGLVGLKNINGTLTICNNSNLNNISGIENVSASSIEFLSIYNNPKLSECNTENICDYLISYSGESIIHDNLEKCNSESEIVSECTSSVDNLDIESFVRIYPNPSSGYLKIENNSGLTFEDIKIYNNVGQLEYISQQTELTINNLKSGIYIVEINFNGIRFYDKLVILE